MAWVTFFPIGDIMRANFFTYRDVGGEWTRAMRSDPLGGMFAIAPGLRRHLGDVEVVGKVQIGTIDLTEAEHHRRSGVVLVGDAYRTSCPVTGTGATRALTDVVRLCQVYVPRWLATTGMGADKIGQFYDDSEKRQCDSHAMAFAAYCRSFGTSTAWPWRLRRWKAFGKAKLTVLRRASGVRRRLAVAE
jgi:2-polyprenyl-6-methoxyphenol hydroxylase-like FAD-dependent oxidoreductase